MSTAKTAVLRLQAFSLAGLGLFLTVSTVSSSSAFSAPNKKEPEPKPAEVKLENPLREQFDRNVDRAAMASQDQAIAKLKILLKRYQGRAQEPGLLIKLGELYQQYSDIQFRVAHGQASKSGGAIGLNAYKSTLKTAVSTFSTVIAKYPRYAEVYQAYFYRGKANEDLGNTASATSDYLHLVKNFPDVDECIPAYMSLAEFSIDANQHAKAISYLMKVNDHPESPYYPFALYKLAWSHYNLSQIAQALKFAETQVSYYNDLEEETKKRGQTSDIALKETTLIDIPVFYFKGYEDGLSPYTLDDALAYFRKIESGPILGKMFSRFARLLRSHSHEADLLKWKDQILAKESDRPESLDVLVTTYEYQLNRRLYKPLIDSTLDMVRLYRKHPEYEGFSKAQKLILDTATSLQESIVANKDSSQAMERSRSLAALYDSFVQIVPDSDPRIPRVHYNLAETLFVIRDFPGATTHYRWVVDHGKWALPKPTEKEFNVVDASLKAIASRYETLLIRKIVPKELSPRALSKDSDSKLDAELSEWITWLDRHVALSAKGTENFVFESARALYGQGHIKDALARLERFALKDPNGKYAIPAASLILDTYIASSDWRETHEKAEDFREVKAWKQSDFGKRLFTVASDAWFKLIEIAFKDKDPGSQKEVVSLSRRFMKDYSSSPLLAEVLLTAGNAATAIEDPEQAQEFYSILIKDLPAASNLSGALAARAVSAEKLYNFELAATDLSSLLALPAKRQKLEVSRLPALREKALLLAWLTGNPSTIRGALKNTAVCVEGLEKQCEIYEVALSLLEGSNTKSGISAEVSKDAFDIAHNKRKDQTLKALWALRALQGAKHLSFRDRNHLLRHVSAGWESIDSMIRFALISELSELIPNAIRLNRTSMGEVAPLRAEERYITRRVEVIRELENAVTKVAKLPVARLRASLLSEIAQVYFDLSKGLSALPLPKDLAASEQASYEETLKRLTLPFEEKGHEIRAKAFEIASNFAIEDDAFKEVSEPFFTDNPSQAKRLKPRTKWATPRAIDLEFMAHYDDPSWRALIRTKPYSGNDLKTRIKAHWAHSIKNKNAQQIAFFLQESQDKKVVDPATHELMTAVSLATLGSRAEALLGLHENQSRLKAEVQLPIRLLLIHYYVRSCSRERVQALLKGISEDQLTREQQSIFANASGYLNAN